MTSRPTTSTNPKTRSPGAAPRGEAEEQEPRSEVRPTSAPPHNNLPVGGSGAPPSLRLAVYTIIEQGSGRAPRWTRIGIAYINRDESLNVVLDALPVNGTLHIRDFPPREAGERNQ